MQGSICWWLVKHVRHLLAMQQTFTAEQPPHDPAPTCTLRSTNRSRAASCCAAAVRLKRSSSARGNMRPDIMHCKWEQRRQVYVDNSSSLWYPAQLISHPPLAFSCRAGRSGVAAAPAAKAGMLTSCRRRRCSQRRSHCAPANGTPTIMRKMHVQWQLAVT